MHIVILSLFPQVIKPFLSESIIKRATNANYVKFTLVNWREFASDAHQTVDDRPFGGGPGMLLMIEPIVKAIKNTEAKFGQFHKILLSPQGSVYTQSQAVSYATKHQNLMLICGHYEGFDERILSYVDQELSIGQYVLGSGESAAMVVIDSIVRLIPGVLKKPEATLNESFTKENQIDYPQYTKPVEFQGLKVPSVLLSGNHQKISDWREIQANKKTNKKENKN